MGLLLEDAHQLALLPGNHPSSCSPLIRPQHRVELWQILLQLRLTAAGLHSSVQLCCIKEVLGLLGRGLLSRDLLGRGCLSRVLPSARLLHCRSLLMAADAR